MSQGSDSISSIFEIHFYFDKDPSFSKIVPVTVPHQDEEGLVSLRAAAHRAFNISENLNFILHSNLDGGLQELKNVNKLLQANTRKIAIRITPQNFFIHILKIAANVLDHRHVVSGTCIDSFCGVNPFWSDEDYGCAMKAAVSNSLALINNVFSSFVPVFDIKIFTDRGIGRDSVSSITREDRLIINVLTNDVMIIDCIKKSSAILMKRTEDESSSSSCAARSENDLNPAQIRALEMLSSMGFPAFPPEVMTEHWARYPNEDTFVSFVIDHPELWQDASNPISTEPSSRGMEEGEVLHADDFPHHIPTGGVNDDEDDENMFYDAKSQDDNIKGFTSPLLERVYTKFRDLCGVELAENQLMDLCSRYPTDDEFESMVNHYWNGMASDAMDLEALQAEEIAMAAEENQEVELACPLCLENVEISKLISFCDDSSHMCCHPCLLRYIQNSVTASEYSAPHIPACPKANGPEGCRYVLRLDDVEHVINVCMQLPHDDIDMTWPQSQELLKTVSELFLIRAFRNDNFVRCPSCPMKNESECYWVSVPPEHRGKRLKVACPTCTGEFCSDCLRSPFHYHCKCDEVVNYSRAWMEWIGGGRDAYAQEMARQNQQYAAALADFNRQKESHEQEVLAAQARFRELQTNEEHFARVCKHCPKCRAVVEKIDGCDSMICGRDYHGGNIGNTAGCGASFNWSTAPAYVANTGQARVAQELQAVPPEKAHEVQHFLAPGIPLRCDECHEPIVGPCIRCLNCPSFNICLQCNLTKHYPDGDQVQGHGNRHICTVVFESDIAASAPESFFPYSYNGDD